MRFNIWRTWPAFIHSILNIGYMFYIFDPNGDFNYSNLVIGFLILLLVNSMASTLVSRGQWRQLPIALLSYILYLALSLFLVLLIGEPNLEVNDDPGNPAIGFGIIAVALPLSIISLLFGTIIGITAVQLRKQVKTFNKGSEMNNE